MMVLIHSTCKKKIIKCRHKSCSSYKTSLGEWSLSVQSLSPMHQVPDQIPMDKDRGCGQQIIKIQILADLKKFQQSSICKGCGRWV